MSVAIEGIDAKALPERSVGAAMRAGMRGRCPSCGKGSLFSAYLKVRDTCPACGEALHHQRADDAPPYFTITLVGHIVVPGLLLMERFLAPPMWVQAAIWLPATVILSLLLLPPIKGALIGLQWANYMHGFDPRQDSSDGDIGWESAPENTTAG